MKKSVEIDKCYKIAFEAIVEKKEIQDVIDEMYHYTGIPSFIVNLTGELITVLRKDIFEFKNLHMGLKGMPGLIEAIRRSSDNISQEPAAGYTTSLEGIDYKFSYMPLSIKGNTEAYHISIYKTEEELKIIREITPVIARTITELLEDRIVNTKYNRLLLREFISKSIFDDRVRSKSSLDELYDAYSEFLKPGFLMVVVRPKIYSDNILEKILQYVYEEFEGPYCYIKQNNLYILFTNVVKRQEEAIEQYLEQTLSKYRCICGMTKLFYDVEMIAGEQLIIRDILDSSGVKEDREKTVFKEENYREKILYSAIIDKYGKAAYRDESLKLLEKEDETNGTFFFDTLKEYLLCGCNVGMTAGHLYIHRNTMIYRLTKIKEILGVNVNEPVIARRLLLQILLEEIDNEEKRDRIWN